MRIFLVFSIFYSVLAFSYEDIPIPLTNHIKLSDVIVVGTYVGKHYRKLHNSQVVTEFKFNLEKHVGLKLSNSEKSFEFRVLHPGGVWMDKDYISKDTPEFRDREKVVLFLRSDKNGHWFVNSLQSKYTIEKHGRNYIMVSSAYPLHPTIGKYNFNVFSEKLIQIKGSDLTAVTHKTYTYTPNMKRNFNNIYTQSLPTKRRNGRSIASIGNKRKPQSQPPQHTKMDPFWLLLGMGVLSGIYQIIRKST
jgi:hypothetical protein